MPDETLALVRRAFDAYAAGDIDAPLEVLDPGVRIHSLLTEAERDTYDGHEGAREWLAAVLDIFPDWRPEPLEMREVGGAVVARIDVTATAAGSGLPIKQVYWNAARVDAGLISWFGFFRTEEDALAAARR
jgi:hypothetical protein